MKTKIYTTAIALILSVTSIFAKSPQAEMQATIKSHINYPAFLIEKQIQGSVFVEFTIKENGTIEVINSNSLSGDLMVYVVEEMSSITLFPSPELQGQKFLMRFDFNLE